MLRKSHTHTQQRHSFIQRRALGSLVVSSSSMRSFFHCSHSFAFVFCGDFLLPLLLLSFAPFSLLTFVCHSESFGGSIRGDLCVWANGGTSFPIVCLHLILQYLPSHVRRGSGGGWSGRRWCEYSRNKRENTILYCVSIIVRCRDADDGDGECAMETFFFHHCVRLCYDGNKCWHYDYCRCVVVSFYHVQDVIRMSQLRENVWRAIASMFHSVFISIVTTLVCCRCLCLGLPWNCTICSCRFGFCD